MDWTLQPGAYGSWDQTLGLGLSSKHLYLQAISPALVKAIRNLTSRYCIAVCSFPHLTVVLYVRKYSCSWESAQVRMNKETHVSKSLSNDSGRGSRDGSEVNICCSSSKPESSFQDLQQDGLTTPVTPDADLTSSPHLHRHHTHVVHIHTLRLTHTHTHVLFYTIAILLLCRGKFSK